MLLPSRTLCHFILKLDFKHGLSVLPVTKMINTSFSILSKRQQHHLKEEQHNWDHPSFCSSNVAEKEQSKVKFEVWLNTDILRGPGTAFDSSGLNPQHFLHSCKILPQATLSLGWTTGFDHFYPFDARNSSLYERHHVDNMLVTCNDSSLVHPMQQFTFPIRASLARESWEALERLANLNSYSNPSRPQPSIAL